MIYLISNYSNESSYESEENYIGYKLSRESAIDWIFSQTKLGILSSYSDMNNAEYFSDSIQTWIVREIKELKC